MATESEPVQIRALTRDDIEALRILARETWYAHYPGIISVAQIEYMLAQRYAVAVLQDELASDTIWWDLLWCGAELRAFASCVLAERPDEMKLDKLYVHPSHQRHGYGGQLIERALAHCRAQNRSLLTLAVNRHNQNAIDAYRKHGFAIERSVAKDIGGGFVMDDYIMGRGV
jgi:GNAT superfamily N-acetyltransferase